jgi:hypothetical protein
MGHGSPAKNPRGVDVRFDSGSGGIAPQELMSLLNVVTLSNKHPDCAIEHGQFGEASQPGLSRERGNICVELDRSSLTVHTCPCFSAIRRGCLLLDRHTAEGVAQVGGEIIERAGCAGEEDGPALMIHPLRHECERETQRGPDRYVRRAGEIG